MTQVSRSDPLRDSWLFSSSFLLLLDVDICTTYTDADTKNERCEDIQTNSWVSRVFGKESEVVHWLSHIDSTHTSLSNTKTNRHVQREREIEINDGEGE